VELTYRDGSVSEIKSFRRWSLPRSRCGCCCALSYRRARNDRGFGSGKSGISRPNGRM